MILCSSPGVTGGQGLKPAMPVTREERKKYEKGRKESSEGGRREREK
jgi:hypothetical protein